MPARLNIEQVKKEFEKYGFELPPNFRYKNLDQNIKVTNLRNGQTKIMSLKNLRYHVNRGKYKEYVPPEIEELMAINMPEQHFITDAEIEAEIRSQTIDPKFERWLKNHDKYYFETLDQKLAVYNYYKQHVKSLSKRQGYEFKLSKDNDYYEMLNGFIEAAKTQLPKLGNKNIVLTLTDIHGKICYKNLNENTMYMFNELFDLMDDYWVSDSNDNDIHNTLHNLASIKVEFVNKSVGKRDKGGFFPFVNTSNLDLTKYGIYNEQGINDEKLNECCLVTAFRNSNLFTDDEIKLLQSTIKTRYVKKVELRSVSDLFHVNIHIKKISNSTYNYSYANDNYNRTINLLIMFNHYMLDDVTSITKCYIENMSVIDSDKRFMNHARKMMLKNFSDQRYTFAKEGLRINDLINVMIKCGMMKPLDQKVMDKYLYSFKPITDTNFNFARRVIIDDPPKSQTIKYDRTSN